MIVTCAFAGCATFSIDKVKYYNEILATVGDHNITRFELLSAYNSYGKSYYVSQLGQSEQSALSSTLDLLIDRESLYLYALDNQNEFGLTAYQVNSIVQDMFDSIDEQMATYIKTAKKIFNITIDNSDTSSEDEDTAYKYDDYAYTKRATVSHTTTYYTDASKTTTTDSITDYFINDYFIEYIVENEPASFDNIIDMQYLNDYTLPGIIDAIKDAYLTHFYTSLENEDNNQDKLYNKAVSLLSNNLIEYEYYLRDSNGNSYNTKTTDLLTRYFKRNFDSQIKSQYLTNIRTVFLENEYLSISQLNDKYENLVQRDYARYLNHTTTYKNKMKDIGSDADTVYYHPNITDTNFGYFTHTLLKLSDAQIKALSNLELNKNSISEEKYEQDYNKIISEIKVQVRDLDTGLLTDVYNDLDTIMIEYSNILKISDYTLRLSEFIKFMFKYTGDTVTLTSIMPYVVGDNGYSGMEEAFTEEAVRLISDGKSGDMTPADLDNLVVTSYGVHLLFYIGKVENAISYTSLNQVFIRDDYGLSNLNLYYKVINPLTGKTYFDMLFDTVYPASSDTENYTSNTGYSDYETDIIRTSQETYNVTKYATKINATKTSL